MNRRRAGTVETPTAEPSDTSTGERTSHGVTSSLPLPSHDLASNVSDSTTPLSRDTSTSSVSQIKLTVAQGTIAHEHRSAGIIEGIAEPRSHSRSDAAAPVKYATENSVRSSQRTRTENHLLSTEDLNRAEEPRYPKRRRVSPPTEPRRPTLQQVDNHSGNDAIPSIGALSPLEVPNLLTGRDYITPTVGEEEQLRHHESMGLRGEDLENTQLERLRANRETPETSAQSQESVTIENVLLTKYDHDTSGKAGRKSRKTRKDKGTTRTAKNIGSSSKDGEGNEASRRIMTRSRKAKDKAITATEQSSRQESTSEEMTKKKKKKRAGTPDGAENVMINPDEVTMDLLLSTKTGEVSHREKAMRQINWDEVRKRRREALSGHNVTDEGNQAQVSEQLERAAREREAAQTRGPRMRILNGAIVVDQASLTIDRHAEATRADEMLEAVEEDDLTRRFNTATFMRANKRDPAERLPMGTTIRDRWNAEQTEAFYEAIRMFGTDFSIIAKMFPGKTRGNIKRKFVREEHANPERIKAALTKETVPLNFETFLNASGLQDTDFVEDAGAIRDELAAEAAERQVEIDRVKAEHEEMQRQRRLATGGENGEDGGKGPTDASGRKRSKGKTSTKKRGKHLAHGGEEAEIVETIED